MKRINKGIKNLIFLFICICAFVAFLMGSMFFFLFPEKWLEGVFIILFSITVPIGLFLYFYKRDSLTKTFFGKLFHLTLCLLFVMICIFNLRNPSSTPAEKLINIIIILLFSSAAILGLTKKLEKSNK